MPIVQFLDAWLISIIYGENSIKNCQWQQYNIVCVLYNIDSFVFLCTGDRKSGGKMDDKTRRRMNGVEEVDEMETKSSSHRASRGSSRVRRSAATQSLGIVAELVFLAAATAGWSTGCPADVTVAGLVSLAISPPLLLLLCGTGVQWSCRPSLGG